MTNIDYYFKFYYTVIVRINVINYNTNYIISLNINFVIISFNIFIGFIIKNIVTNFKNYFILFNTKIKCQYYFI